MGKYLIRANYVGDGVKGLMADGGSTRIEQARAAVESVGGSIESLYFAFGETDLFGICEFPDDASATALSLMINSTGKVNVQLTPLMTPDVVDAAVKMTPTYSPPGA